MPADDCFGASCPAPGPLASATPSATAPLAAKVIRKPGSGPLSSLNGATLHSILPGGYGFVVFTALGSVLMITWKSMKVSMARDEYKIPYPLMFSEGCPAFNCVQRAHQNTMEIYPQFLTCLLIGGLEMPYFSTLGGWLWIVGRISYARGYYTGNPAMRARGSLSMIGMMMLMAASAKFALRTMGLAR